MAQHVDRTLNGLRSELRTAMDQMEMARKETMRAAIEMAESGMDPAQLAPLESAVEGYFKDRDLLRNRLDFVNKVQTLTSTGQKLPAMGELHDQDMARMDGETQAAQGNSKELKAFRKDLANAQTASDSAMPEDEDLVMSQVSESFVCPLTKTTLENPMRSKRCGHTFSHDAITSALKKYKQMPCPVVGCGQNLTLGDLTPDKALERRIKAQSKRK
eukprot:m.124670 g.124670  ORF g.124670 m.124670 type:complete len:216 (+) comp9677_c2_seq1:448-1095(+)